MKLLKEHWFPLLLFAIIIIVTARQLSKVNFNTSSTHTEISTDGYWHAPLTYKLPDDEQGKLIRYGEDIIAHTSSYFGPRGTIANSSNGMNCQNCHLDAGTRVWGNNYGAVYATYPKFRERSGSIESIVKRVNDCFERSLNGKALDSTSKEMQAIVAYMKFLGSNVAKGTKPKGSGIMEVSLLNRSADTIHGRKIFIQTCASCHNYDGQGTAKADNSGYIYPPLWGAKSYTIGAGLYRISRLAGYVKANMPFNIATPSSPQLTDEEAWDVAAFINSMPHPGKDISKDWPDISSKPFDHPFGPYADKFTEKQHKLGPFKEIKEMQKKKS